MNKDSFLVSGDGSCPKEHRLLGITYVELYHRASNHFTTVCRARKSLDAPWVCKRQWEVKLQSWVTSQSSPERGSHSAMPEILEGSGARRVWLLCAQSSSHQIWPRMQPELKSLVVLCTLITTDFISTLWYEISAKNYTCICELRISGLLVPGPSNFLEPKCSQGCAEPHPLKHKSKNAI